MQILFLPSVKRDLQWFRRYYTNVFPDGGERANHQFLALLETLKAHPLIGHVSDMDETVRELRATRTPFVVLYRLQEDRIEILRIVDARSGWKERTKRP